MSARTTSTTGRNLCDTSGVDPYTGLAFDASSCDVDHIVAAKEAHESGGHSWDVATRERFGNDALNLVASRDCVNRSKGSSDTAEWSGVQSGTCEGAQLTAAGRCFWAARTVAVKYRYDLAVDARELTALESGLNQCPPDIDIEAPPQATLTTMPITHPSPPPPPIAETTASESDCHPAYDPCLPNLPGDALNCGDLTASQRPVSVKQIGVDPVPPRQRPRRPRLRRIGGRRLRSTPVRPLGPLHPDRLSFCQRLRRPASNRPRRIVHLNWAFASRPVQTMPANTVAYSTVR